MTLGQVKVFLSKYVFLSLVPDFGFGTTAPLSPADYEKTLKQFAPPPDGIRIDWGRGTPPSRTVGIFLELEGGRFPLPQGHLLSEKATVKSVSDAVCPGCVLPVRGDGVRIEPPTASAFTAGPLILRVLSDRVFYQFTSNDGVIKRGDMVVLSGTTVDGCRPMIKKNTKIGPPFELRLRGEPTNGGSSVIFLETSEQHRLEVRAFADVSLKVSPQDAISMRVFDTDTVGTVIDRAAVSARRIITALRVEKKGMWTALGKNEWLWPHRKTIFMAALEGEGAICKSRQPGSTILLYTARGALQLEPVPGATLMELRAYLARNRSDLFIGALEDFSFVTAKNSLDNGVHPPVITEPFFLVSAKAAFSYRIQMPDKTVAAFSLPENAKVVALADAARETAKFQPLISCRGAPLDPDLFLCSVFFRNPSTVVCAEFPYRSCRVMAGSSIFHLLLPRSGRVSEIDAVIRQRFQFPVTEPIWHNHQRLEPGSQPLAGRWADTAFQIGGVVSFQTLTLSMPNGVNKTVSLLLDATVDAVFVALSLPSMTSFSQCGYPVMRIRNVLLGDEPLSADPIEVAFDSRLFECTLVLHGTGTRHSAIFGPEDTTRKAVEMAARVFSLPNHFFCLYTADFCCIQPGTSLSTLSPPREIVIIRGITVSVQTSRDLGPESLTLGEHETVAALQRHFPKCEIALPTGEILQGSRPLATLTEAQRERLYACTQANLRTVAIDDGTVVVPAWLRVQDLKALLAPRMHRDTHVLKVFVNGTRVDDKQTLEAAHGEICCVLAATRPPVPVVRPRAVYAPDSTPPEAPPPFPPGQPPPTRAQPEPESPDRSASSAPPPVPTAESPGRSRSSAPPPVQAHLFPPFAPGQPPPTRAQPEPESPDRSASSAPPPVPTAESPGQSRSSAPPPVPRPESRQQDSPPHPRAGPPRAPTPSQESSVTKPVNYLELIAKLEMRSKRPRLECCRCFNYHDYDFNCALEDLTAA
jgi:hypothetical protein